MVLASREHVLNQSLVDAHLVAVPGLGTLTARGLTGGDLEGLGGQTDGALGAEVLVLGSVDDLSADLLEDLDLAGGEGDADLVALLQKQFQSVANSRKLIPRKGRGEHVREPLRGPSRASGKT